MFVLHGREKVAHFFAAAGMLSMRQNNEMRQIFERSRDCAKCYFAHPVFVTKARNAKNAAEQAIRTQDLADFEHMHHMYSQMARHVEPRLQYAVSDEEEEE